MTSNPLPDGWTANDFVGDDFEAHLRHLMANAMRVARGSGRPHPERKGLLGIRQAPEAGAIRASCEETILSDAWRWTCPICLTRLDGRPEAAR